MRPATASNQITRLYWRTLMSHTWSRHLVRAVHHRHGRITYHLNQ